MWPLAIKNKAPSLLPQTAPSNSPKGERMVTYHPPLGGTRGAPSFFTNEVRYFLCEAHFVYDVWMATTVVPVCGIAAQELVL